MNSHQAINSGAILAALCFFFLSTAASGVQVSHHGQYVDLKGGSADCIICHDGRLAKDVGYCTDGCGHNTAHAIDVEYPPRGKEREYRSAGHLLRSGGDLENNRITCRSCHNLTIPDRHHLIIDNSESRLCLTCHIK